MTGVGKTELVDHLCGRGSESGTPEAGWENISLNLSSGPPMGFWASIPVMLGAIALVVSYFSGPMLNFGDFSRYGKSFGAVRRGNGVGGACGCGCVGGSSSMLRSCTHPPTSDRA